MSERKAEYKIGSRRSPLALAQAEMVIRQLRSIYPNSSFSAVPIATTGDRHTSQPLSAIGNKGLFTKELELALLAGDIDLAVHSMKDMGTKLQQEFVIGAVMPRGDARDAFISLKADSVENLPEHALVGTASLRRQAWIEMKRPDIRIRLLRGNVQSRLQKIETGVLDATFLAMAGLDRLKIQGDFIYPIPTDDLVPAPAQGAMAIECLASRQDMLELVAPLNHLETLLCTTAERACLEQLDGSCRTAIGCYAAMNEGGEVELTGCLYQEGAHVATLSAPVENVAQAKNLGYEVGRRVREIANKHSS